MSTNTAGTSRRSHTKSRHGCKTCKRRHIRCDETFPQCRNCSKHQVRCDYMEGQTGYDTSSSNSPIPSTDLYWSTQVESVLDNWQSSGYCSLGDDMYNLHSSGYIFSKSDLHLMYNALWLGGRTTGPTPDYTVWASRMPKFLVAAGNSTYFVHAMLGFGSLSLAWDRGSQDAKSIGYRHGAVALQGLQNAINSFSEENADAVLAASVVLSWQANDFRAWQSLVSGIRVVINNMTHFRSTSQLPELIDQLQLEMPGAYEHYAQAPQDAHLNYQNVLQAVVLAMDHLQPYMSGRAENDMIAQFRDYAQRLLGLNLPHSPEEQFCHLYALRKWLFWVPSTVLKDGQYDYFTMVFLAHLYAMTLAVEPLFPDVASSLVSAVSLPPLEKLLHSFEELESNRRSSTASQNDIDKLLSLIMWPRQVAAAYQARRFDTTYGTSAVSRSPVGFDAFSSDLTQTSESWRVPQRSPAFRPQHGSSVSTSSTWSSSGSTYLDLPMLASNSPAVGRSYTTPNLPSMSTGYDPDEALYTESQFDYTTGWVYAPQSVWA